MLFTRKKVVRFLLVSIVFLSPYFVQAIYVPTPRDTSLPPVEMEIVSENVDELVELGTFGDLSYYWRESTDVMKIVDNRNGYTWSTGVDLQNPEVYEDACSQLENEYRSQMNLIGISGVGNWVMADSPVNASARLDAGIMKITTGGLNDTHSGDTIALSLNDLVFETGKEYKISFEIYNSRNKEIHVNVVGDDGTLLLTPTTELTLEKNSEREDFYYTVDIEFEMTEAIQNNASIVFEMGYYSDLTTPAQTTLTYMDNFSVYEFDGTNVVDGTNQNPYGDMEVPEENLLVKPSDLMDVCVGPEYKLNDKFKPWANSLVTINYYRNYRKGNAVPAPDFASSSFDWESYQAVNGGAFLYSAESTLNHDVNDPSHKVFDVTFVVRDKTIPPTCNETFFILQNGVCAPIELDVTCPIEGQKSVDGECVSPDPVCEQGFVVKEGECTEAEEGSVVTISVRVHLYLEEDGFRMKVYDEELGGNGLGTLQSIQLAPWMGASGGMHYAYDVDTLRFDNTPSQKPITPGYSLIPDGSGALIRFKNLSVELDQYIAPVYGTNYTELEHHYNEKPMFKALKNATMPVYGIAHGNNQNAFVAYATSGDEYMKIISNPDEHNDVKYNFTFAEFEYNHQYLQVYNKTGAGYIKILDERMQYDIEMNFRFLEGDGSDDTYSADYVGMANYYRDYLIEEGVLHEISPAYSDVPIRLDFFMSDVEKAIFGYTNMITTDVDGVRSILNDITDKGITNINSGLLGWNEGGVTLGDPSEVDYDRQIGTRREFERLINDFNKEGIDISLAQNYMIINEEMMTERRNAARHTNNWYSLFNTFESPISIFYYSRPNRSVEWLEYQTDKFNDLGVSSYTIDGMTNILVSDSADEQDRFDVLALMQDAFGNLDQDKKVNAVEPNSYLWEYTDRYINTPVFNSQFLIETDTVPFLQLILQDTMELYAPYSNFSFYTDSDILRMIDYNVYPSFVLSKEPSYLLADTNSKNFYSTEYELYEDSIENTYNKVNNALGSVLGARWVDREIIANGVVVNYYDNGVYIIINYTDEVVNFEGTDVDAVSYSVVGG